MNYSDFNLNLMQVLSVLNDIFKFKMFFLCLKAVLHDQVRRLKPAFCFLAKKEDRLR